MPTNERVDPRLKRILADVSERSASDDHEIQPERPSLNVNPVSAKPLGDIGGRKRRTSEAVYLCKPGHSRPDEMAVGIALE